MQIDYLFNNAGVLGVGDMKKTKQGLEWNQGINFVSHIVITEKLLPLLKKSKDPRVVTTSSVAQKVAKIDQISVLGNEKDSGFFRYGSSKLSCTIFAKLMSKIHPDILFLSFHPGGVYTSIYHGIPKLLNFLVDMFSFFFRTPWEGA